MLSLQREIQRYLIIAWHILALSAKSEKKRKKKKNMEKYWLKKIQAF